jgi:hypothetical protein
MTQARLVGENEASIPGNGRLDQSFPREWTGAQLRGPCVSVPLDPGRKDDRVGVGLKSHL